MSAGHCQVALLPNHKIIRITLANQHSKLVPNIGPSRSGAWPTATTSTRLRTEVGEEHWPLVSFALHTGLRQGEQFRLRWPEIDLGNVVLTVPRSKNFRARRGDVFGAGESPRRWHSIVNRFPSCAQALLFAAPCGSPTQRY